MNAREYYAVKNLLDLLSDYFGNEMPTKATETARAELEVILQDFRKGPKISKQETIARTYGYDDGDEEA